jgi:hypothetical protein
VFDEDTSCRTAGLVPLMELAEQAGLSAFLEEHVRVHGPFAILWVSR